MIDWEKQPNGKWKVKSEKNDNWYWAYKKIAKQKMKNINPFCDVCNATYSLLDPCIHHLPDNYDGDKRRKEFTKLLKKSKCVSHKTDQETLIFDGSD